MREAQNRNRPRSGQGSGEDGAGSGAATTSEFPGNLWIRLLAFLAVALYLYHAWHYRFLQDDAYIFLRYARNLVEGHGLVWNLGERVEGYTSFLWVLVLGLVYLIDSNVEPIVHVVTLGLGLASLGLTFSLAHRLTGSGLAGVLSILLLASDRTFAVWSTSGMDTRLFGFFVLLAIHFALRFADRPEARSRGWCLGLALAGLCLTRPEGWLLSLLTLGFLQWRGRSDLGAGRVWLPGLIWLGSVALHLSFRLLYYGDWLPNTFHAKVAGPDLAAGFEFLRDFFQSFPLASIGFAAAMVAALWRARHHSWFGYLAGVILAYTGYVTAVGGGFMEFRFLDVLLPLLYLLLGWVLALSLRILTQPLLRGLGIALVGSLLAANGAASARFEESPHRVLTHTQMTTETTLLWVEVGKWLGKVAEPGESLATSAVGAIPYFSRLRCLDIHGLNDREVARLPGNPDAPVGHRKEAPFSYLLKKKITFVLHPMRMFRPGAEPTLGPEEILVEVDNTNPRVLSGRDFLLVVRTTSNRSDLAEDLRRRGVELVAP